MTSLQDMNIKIIKLTFNTRFILAKTCRKIPPVAWIANKLFFEGDDIQVLPLDSTIKKRTFIEQVEINNSVPLSNEAILPSEVLNVMIKKSRYHFIMDFCICRTSNNCKDFPHEFGCLFLGKGTKRISKNLGRHVDADEAIEYVNKCREAGLVHIIGRNKIDSVWLNTGPKEDLLSICNCCPCCCLWKMVPELPKNIGRSLTPMNGIEIAYNIENCTNCGRCTSGTCFVEAITIQNSGIEIDTIKCKKCGRCADVCTNDALTVLISLDAVKNSIERVEKLVDVESE
jgi:ferredoxin